MRQRVISELPLVLTTTHTRPSGEDEESGEGGERTKIEFADGAFSGLKEGGQYNLVVVEDEEAGYGNEELSRGYEAPGASSGGGIGGTSTRSSDITNQLKGMNVDDLRNQTDEYKKLKEARDLEDVLFSG